VRDDIFAVLVAYVTVCFFKGCGCTADNDLHFICLDCCLLSQAELIEVGEFSLSGGSASVTELQEPSGEHGRTLKHAAGKR